MPIPFKAPLTSAGANATFLDKTIDDIKKGKLTLYKINVGDPETITDVQNYINDIADVDGVIGEADPNSKTYSSEEIIANGDNRKVAIGKLDAQSKVNLDKNDSQDITITDHETRIGTNETDIQNIEDAVGAANGICPLDASSKVAAIYLPSYVDDVEEYADLASFPVVGETGKIYVALDTNKTYRWSGTVYVEISPSDVNSVFGRIGIITAQNGDYNATQIGLGNVLNKEQLTKEDGSFNVYAEKAAPVDEDIVLIEDSENLYVKKKVKLSNLLGGGGGGGSTAWIDGDLAPISGFVNGIETKDFDFESDQDILLNVIVPTSYKPGDQVKLLNSKFLINNSSDNVLFKCETILFKAGEDLTANVNSHTSTNAEILLLTANAMVNVGDIDLSDLIGEINSIAVAIGDLLVIRLYRDFNNETNTAQEDAKLLKYASSVSFEG